MKTERARTRTRIASDKEIRCPIPTDPAAGDKTRAVVDWWFENHPEIAAEKYKGRKTHRDALERERLTKTTPNELPAPYDLKKLTKECKAEGYATEYGIAWIESGRIQHKTQKQDKPVSGIPASSFIRCILISKGAGWIIAERPDVASILYDHTQIAAMPPAPIVSRLALSEWLKERHQELESWINNACENDIWLAGLWRQKREEIKAGELSEPMLENPIQSHLLLSLHLAFQSLDALELAMDYGERKDAKLKSNDGDAFFISAMKSGYEAGRRLHQLKAELASIKAMKMASQTSAGKKQSQRTVWITARLDELEKRLGRKADMDEIIEHVEDKTDPISGEKIWLLTPEGDEKKFIQWGTNESTTVQSFKVEISRIRTKRKKFISR